MSLLNQSDFMAFPISAMAPVCSTGDLLGLRAKNNISFLIVDKQLLSDSILSKRSFIYQSLIARSGLSLVTSVYVRITNFQTRQVIYQ